MWVERKGRKERVERKAGIIQLIQSDFKAGKEQIENKNQLSHTFNIHHINYLTVEN